MSARSLASSPPTTTLRSWALAPSVIGLVLGLLIAESAEARRGRQLPSRRVRKEALALMERARKAVSFEEVGTPALRVDGIYSADSADGPYRGRYFLLWASGEAWLEDIRMKPSVLRQQGRDEHGDWSERERQPNWRADRVVLALRDLLQPGRQLRLRRGEIIVSVVTDEHDGEPTTLIWLESSRSRRRSLEITQHDGALVQVTDGDCTRTYDRHVRFDRRRLPSVLTLERQAGVAIELELEWRWAEADVADAFVVTRRPERSSDEVSLPLSRPFHVHGPRGVSDCQPR
ncbi:MAG: hypothetical protein AAF533_03430 [Acidobacteriota bacterium]